MSRFRPTSRMLAAAAAAVMTLAASGALAQQAAGPRIVVPLPDAERGRFLFVSKGCVVCHSVNGVGGTAGPALDAPADQSTIDPTEFAARMWRGAVAMTVLQSTEFGYQIDMTGEEIADLAAFAASPEAQADFSEEAIPEVMQGWSLEEGWEELMESMTDQPPSDKGPE